MSVALSSKRIFMNWLKKRFTDGEGPGGTCCGWNQDRNLTSSPCRPSLTSIAPQVRFFLFFCLTMAISKQFSFNMHATPFPRHYRSLPSFHLTVPPWLLLVSYVLPFPLHVNMMSSGRRCLMLLLLCKPRMPHPGSLPTDLCHSPVFSLLSPLHSDESSMASQCPCGGLWSQTMGTWSAGMPAKDLWQVPFFS